MSTKYKLMEVFGIELEYMITNKDTLDVLPVADQLFKKVMGSISNIVTSERIDWSNELVNHVVEFKNNKPEPRLLELVDLFQAQVHRANKELDAFNAQLMPTAMHPWMSPDKETKLWPHENNEIYNAYDRIFGCKGHGWANLQSLHINISFDDDLEFHKLHSAIRFFLPLIPALSSSSPFVEGRSNGFSSHRLSFYLKNQRKIPSIIGYAIPEVIHSQFEYQEKVLKPMYKDISPLDPEGILQEEWLNSRGAIPKFERGCIEIRLADVQEAPLIDLSIAQFWIKAIETFMSGEWIDQKQSETLNPQELKPILEQTAQFGENTLIENTKYLACFGKIEPMTAQDLLKEILSKLEYDSNETPLKNIIEKILKQGSLSTRIKKSLPEKPTQEELKNIYKRLCTSLNEGVFFEN